MEKVKGRKIYETISPRANESRKSGEASMWTRGRKFYYIHFFSVFMWQASNRAKLPFDEALKGKTNWKTFFRTLLATGLVFFGWGGWNWRNVLRKFLHLWKELIAWGRSRESQGWVTNIRFMFWEIVRNLHTHTSLVFRITLGERIIL